jgi:hypothetical protein
MKKYVMLLILVGIIALSAYYLIKSSSRYSAQSENYIISDVNGKVDIKHEGAAMAVGAIQYQKVSPKDEIQTSENADVQIIFKSGRAVKLKENSMLRVEAENPGTKAPVTTLIKGKVLAKILKASGAIKPGDNVFTVQTPNAVAGVRGTSFLVEIYDSTDGLATRVAVSKGTVRVKPSSFAPDADVPAGYKTFVGKTNANLEVYPLTEVEKKELEEIDLIQTASGFFEIMLSSIKDDLGYNDCSNLSDLTKHEMGIIASVVTNYKMKFHKMPESLDQLDIEWKRPDHKDSCNTPYLYKKIDENTAELLSASSDREYYTDDDIILKIKAEY